MRAKSKDGAGIDQPLLKKKNTEDTMFKQAYSIKINGRDHYRSFPTQDEARKYSGIVFRGAEIAIDIKPDYPNSRFINNRTLTVRQRHV
jgi:hypothetical protein